MTAIVNDFGHNQVEGIFNGFIELSPEELDFVSGGHHDIIRGAIDGGFYGGLAGAAGSGGDPHVTIHSAIGGAVAGGARAASGPGLEHTLFFF